MGESVTDEIERYIDGLLPEPPLARKENVGITFDYAIGRNRYIGYLISLATRSYKGIKVGLDCANGSSWNIAKAVFDALGTDEGNNFKIGEYKVELGAEADEETVPADKVKDILDKKPFVYNGEIYIKVNGKVYTVRSRANAGNSDDYDKARKLISGKK